MEENLLNLQCHFTWKPLTGVAECPLKSKIKLDPQSRIDFLKMDIQMNHEIEVPALTLIAYMYTQLEKPNLAEALCVNEEAIKKSRAFHTSDPERGRGYEIVSLGAKAHLLHLTGNREKEVDNVLSQLQHLNPMSDKAQAFIHGLHAYACSTLGPSKYRQGLMLSIRAAALDPSWYAWPMSVASLAGRIRRFVEGSKSYPTAMEEENMQRAVVLSQEKQPLPLVFLADIYFTKGRFNGCAESDFPPVLLEAQRLYKMAYKLGSNTTYVLTRCGKAFAYMQMERVAEECFQRSLKLQPNDCLALRGLGKFYEFSERKKDFDLALDYYTRANNEWQQKNIFSELDVCRIRKKLDRNFNDLETYQKLAQKFSDDKRALAVIQNVAKKQEEYLRSRQDKFHNNNRNGFNNNRQSNFRGRNNYNNRGGRRGGNNDSNQHPTGRNNYKYPNTRGGRDEGNIHDNQHPGSQNSSVSNNRGRRYEGNINNQQSGGRNSYNGPNEKNDQQPGGRNSYNGPNEKGRRYEGNDNHRFGSSLRSQSCTPGESKSNFQQRSRLPYDQNQNSENRVPSHVNQAPQRTQGQPSSRSPSLNRKYPSFNNLDLKDIERKSSH